MNAIAGTIIIRKLELLLEIIIMMGDDENKVLSFIRKELNEIIWLYKSDKNDN